MKYALARRKLRKSGRVLVQNLKKNGLIKRIGLLLIVTPLVIPAGMAQGASNETVIKPAPEIRLTASVATVPQVQLSQNGQIATVPTRQITIDKVDSAHQTAEKQAIAKYATYTAVKVATNTGVCQGPDRDTSPEVKREWVKKAAAAYGIDWKILEAVWQVESGKRWYSCVTNHSGSGAMGPLQFMPGTWRSNGVDGNGDGKTDVFDAQDALFGAARLLKAGVTRTGTIEGGLLGYCGSWGYVEHVKSIANSIQE